jgi:protein gp37
MSDGTKIEWTDATWNPIRGCIKISPGCKHCYAQTFAERFRGVPGHPYERGFDPRVVEGKLTEPFAWGRSRRVFVNSMSDLFQEAIPDVYIERVFEVMARADWHTYQVLTKRADRMQAWMERAPEHLRNLPHVWLGVSVEDRKYGLPRILHLRSTPARIHFLSVEPLLEDLGDFCLDGIEWVIAGGESGAGARRMDPAWIRSLRDRCAAHRVPFFFKQWGGVQKNKAGRVLDGLTHDEQPDTTRKGAPGLRERRALSAAMESASLLLTPRRLPEVRDAAGG